MKNLSLLFTSCSRCWQSAKIVLLLIFYSFSIVGMVSVVNWIRQYNEPIVEFQQGSVNPISIVPGQVFDYKQPIKKLKSCDGVVDRWISGQCGKFQLEHTVADLGPGVSIVNRRFFLPSLATDGTCEFHARHEYRCNVVDELLSGRVFYPPIIPFKVTYDVH